MGLRTEDLAEAGAEGTPVTERTSGPCPAVLVTEREGVMK